MRECNIEVMCESAISNVRECNIEVMCESAISR